MSRITAHLVVYNDDNSRANFSGRTEGQHGHYGELDDWDNNRRKLAASDRPDDRHDHEANINQRYRRSMRRPVIAWAPSSVPMPVFIPNLGSSDHQDAFGSREEWQCRFVTVG
jgi:hypothetical protein